MSFNEDSRNRTKNFAIELIKFFKTLPRTVDSQIIGKQLLRSATSVAANFRAATRARSKAEFFAKVSIVVEEADEVVFWIEPLEGAGIVDKKRTACIYDEAVQNKFTCVNFSFFIIRVFYLDLIF